MNAVSVRSTGLQSAPDHEPGIINRREIIPLLAKARQVLAHYEKSMNCSAVVVDKAGIVIKTAEYKRRLRFCDLCRKYSHGPSQGKQKNRYPCEKEHIAALGESHRTDVTYIYTCDIGFIYWTSPLYRKGRYAGALIAGQVLLGPFGEAAEKFRAGCGDKTASENFSKMLEDVQVKSHEEIQAMARLLGICAGEISEEGEDHREMIRRMAGQKNWQKTDLRNMWGLSTGTVKKKRAPQGKDPVSTPADGRDEPRDNAGFPLEDERMLLAAFRRGDNETGSRILKELMDSIVSENPGDLEIVRLRAIELVVLLSRAAVNGAEPAPSDDSGASGSDTMLETNNRYFRRIRDSKTSEELIENLRLIAERMSGRIFSFQGIRHASVLRKAERFIWENYTRKISLDEIARASGLSAPYFSTIFKEEMGENLSSYVNRLRVEKAAAMLTDTGKALREIAGLCGFEDQSWFSKIFKNYAGMSPGKYRENGGGQPRFQTRKTGGII